MCLHGIESRSPSSHARVKTVPALSDLDLDLAAAEAQVVVGQQRAREQAGLAQDLEAVADPEHRAAVAREGDDVLHDRREARDGADAQVVAIGEAARDDDGVDVLQPAVGVPQQHGLSHPRGRELRVDVVAGAREADDAELHAPCVAGSPATIS